jgi:hypothetical protein
MSDEADVVAAFERGVDPARPEGGPFGCRVIGYGEVSAVLVLDALPGRVLKRMSGFRRLEDAERYAERVARYVAALAERGVRVVPTAAHVVRGHAPVAYLVQPLFPAETLGTAVVARADADTFARRLCAVLDAVGGLLRANREGRGGVEVTVDAQLSNWVFADADERPRLIDVGTPLFRRDGRVETEGESIYRAFPPPLRWWLRRQRVVERYFTPFFDQRGVIVDLLGNFLKERMEARLPEALVAANAWLARLPERERVAPILESDVRRYYARDAASLELSLRVRRATRFATTRILRRRYDFVLPGRVAR